MYNVPMHTYANGVKVPMQKPKAPMKRKSKTSKNVQKRYKVPMQTYANGVKVPMQKIKGFYAKIKIVKM